MADRTGNWKLTAGRLWEAWRKYPSQRQALKNFPPGPPIFVTGTHRSGTTWVANMLAETGLWYVHEPFNPNKNIWKQSFTYASPNHERPDIDAYFSQLVNGRFRRTAGIDNTDHWLKPLRLFRPAIKRVLVKDPLACLLTGYLNRHFDLKTLVLFRHPAGFVSSVTRLGWPIGGFLKDFLCRPDLMDSHLSPFAELMEQYQDRDDVPAAAVLHGVLNTLLWNQIQADPDIRYYLFEHLCQDPLNSMKAIFSELELPYSEATRRRHTRLCLRGSSESGDYHPHAVARNSSAMADSWKRQLTAGQVQQIHDIWQHFDVPLYRKNEQWLATVHPGVSQPVKRCSSH